MHLKRVIVMRRCLYYWNLAKWFAWTTNLYGGIYFNITMHAHRDYKL